MSHIFASFDFLWFFFSEAKNRGKIIVAKLSRDSPLWIAELMNRGQHESFGMYKQSYAEDWEDLLVVKENEIRLHEG